MTVTTADSIVNEASTASFEVRLDNFEGPFDLLLQLISKHKLDVTEVALSKVTDEFIKKVDELAEEKEKELLTL